MAENSRGAHMLRKLGISPPKTNPVSAAAARAQALSVTSTELSSFTQSEAELLGHPKSPRSLQLQAPLSAAAKVLAWRRSAKFEQWTSPAYKKTASKVLLLKKGSDKQGSTNENKENVTPNISCPNPSAAKEGDGDKASLEGSKGQVIPAPKSKRRLDFPDSSQVTNGGKQEEVLQEKECEIKSNDHILSSDDEEPLSALVLKPLLKGQPENTEVEPKLTDTEVLQSQSVKKNGSKITKTVKGKSQMAPYEKTNEKLENKNICQKKSKSNSAIPVAVKQKQKSQNPAKRKNRQYPEKNTRKRKTCESKAPHGSNNPRDTSDDEAPLATLKVQWKEQQKEPNGNVDSKLLKVLPKPKTKLKILNSSPKISGQKKNIKNNGNKKAHTSSKIHVDTSNVASLPNQKPVGKIAEGVSISPKTSKIPVKNKNKDNKINDGVISSASLKTSADTSNAASDPNQKPVTKTAVAMPNPSNTSMIPAKNKTKENKRAGVISSASLKTSDDTSNAASDSKQKPVTKTAVAVSNPLKTSKTQVKDSNSKKKGNNSVILPAPPKNKIDTSAPSQKSGSIIAVAVSKPPIKPNDLPTENSAVCSGGTENEQMETIDLESTGSSQFFTPPKLLDKNVTRTDKPPTRTFINMPAVSTSWRTQDAVSSSSPALQKGANFVFTVPSSTPKSSSKIILNQASKQDLNNNRGSTAGTSAMDLSLQGTPLDFSRKSGRDEDSQFLSDDSLLDSSCTELIEDLTIRKPTIQKSFSLSNLNQNSDSATHNISAASSSSTGRCLRSKTGRKQPVYYCDSSEEETLELEGETEWRVDDPVINAFKNNTIIDSDISSGDSSEDEIQVTLPKKQLGKQWKNKLVPPSDLNEASSETTDWIHEDIVTPVLPPVNNLPPDEEMRDPHAYFQYFFDDELLDAIVQYTNLFSVLKDGGERCLNMTRVELQQFLGVWMYMGINVLPGIRDYWAKETLVNQVASTMTFNRFQKIRSHLHFYDKSQESSLPADDRFAKVRLILDKMKTKCNSLDQEENYSIDETMVPYKGRFAGSLRQFIRNKPHRFGVKIFNLAGSSGIVYDFLPYAGTDTFRDIEFTPEEEAMGLGAKVVIGLSKMIRQPANKCVYFDNFFSSVKLVRYLKDEKHLFSTGTVRNNRIDKCPLKSDFILGKEGRGAYDYKSKDGVQVTKWFDSKVVHLVSSFAGVGPEGTAQRYDKTAKTNIAVPIPHVIQLYNSKMGGVDLSDMLVELLRSPTRARRWYLSVFGYMMDLAVVNSFLVYKRHAQSLNKVLVYKTLKCFKLAISQHLRLSGSLIHETGPKIRKQIMLPRYSRPNEDERYDRRDHWPSYHLPQGRCKYCVDGKTTVICGKCNLHLCFVPTRQCFLKFHLKEMEQME